MKKILALLLALALSSTTAQAADAGGESIESVKATVLNLIRALVDQGVIGAGKAQDMLRQAGLDPALLNAPQVSQSAPPSGEAAVPATVVRVPYLPQTVKDELRDEVRQEIVAQAREERWGQPGALPDWMGRISVFGDVRVRYQREQYPGDNAAPQQVDAWYQLPFGTTKDTATSREQEVVRARVGVEGRLGEDFKAVVRVVAVNGDTATASPVTYNVDEASYGRPYSAGIDVANLQWQHFPWLRAAMGRMSNPYGGTDLIFASDLSFDGIVASLGPQLTPTWKAGFTAGMHPLTSNWVGPYNSASNAWLYVGQLSTEWKGRDESSLRVAGTYYDYVALEGQPNPASVPQNTFNAASAPPFRILGNTMFNLNWFSDPNATPVYGYASKFRLADAYAKYEYAGLSPYRVSLEFDWVRNTGFNADEIRKRLGAAVQGLNVDAQGLTALDRPRVNGYRVGFQLGKGELARFGDWQVFGGYRYLERDAVPDAFTSLDYRLGGTDQRATIAGMNLALTKRMMAKVFVTSAKSIDAPIKYGFDTWFVDLYGTF